MREQVIVTPVIICKAGQINYFQIRLPQNTKYIIGVEVGGRKLSREKRIDVKPVEAIKTEVAFREMSRTTNNLSFNRNKLIGELKLQSCEESNIFYAREITSDENMGFGDYSETLRWKAKAFTHQIKAEEEKVIVHGKSTILKGQYKDMVGLENKIDYHYLVNVYVWVELKTEQNKQN
jgi:hypothetical protein